MSCHRLTLKDGRKVCLKVKGKLRHHMDYTDDEIKRGFAEGGDKHKHGAKKKGSARRGMGARLMGRG